MPSLRTDAAPRAASLSRSILVLSLALGSALAMPFPAAAQSQDAARQYDVPAGPLTEALNRYAQQSGVALAVQAHQLQGLQSSGLRGRYRVEEGFNLLLAGSGYVARKTPSGYVLAPAPRRADSASPTALPAITVTGAAETAYVPSRTTTGSKSGAPLDEIPQSVSVVTRAQMQAQGALTVNEALRYTPGVFAETRGTSARYDLPQMRGFGGDGMGGGYRYLDGLRVFNTAYYATPQFDAYGLESIEVLRGPASALYGQSSPGGMLSLVSKRPTADPVREVQLQAGSNDYYQAGFDFGGSVNQEDTLLYRLTGLARDANTSIAHTKEERMMITPAFTWKPSSDTSLTLLANYQHDPHNGWHGWVPAHGSLLPNPLGEIPRDFFDGEPSFDKFDRTQQSISYLLEHRVNDTWQLRQNARYMTVEVEDNNVYTQGLVSVGDVPTDYRTLRRGSYLSLENIDALTLDNQAEAVFSTGALDHTLLLGLDYQKMDGRVRIGYGTAPDLDLFDPVYGVAVTPPAITQDIRQKQRQTGLYMQDQIKWRNWIATLNLRHDWSSGTTRTRNPQTDAPAAETRQDDRSWTGRAGLSYRFDNGVAPYASYATSFEPLMGTDIDGNPFKPTEGRQMEVGVKYAPAGTGTLFTAALFDITQRNVRSAATDIPGQYRQLGEVASRGLELEAKFRPLKDLNVIASYTYQEVDIAKDPPSVTGGASNEGKTPYLTPTHQAALWADYAFNAGTLSGLTIGGGVRYVGSSWADSANTVKVPAYTLLDAMVRYDFGRNNTALRGLNATIHVKNLTDKSYVAGCAGRLRSCYWGYGRTVMATLNYQW